MPKPENQFIRSVHSYIPRSELYYMKNHNAYVAGIPDVWYSGHANDLWIEYKFIKTAAPRVPVVPNLSKQQISWIQLRQKEGRDVIVIVGCPKGGAIFQKLDDMVHGLSPKHFVSNLKTRKELADYILNFCNRSHYATAQYKIERRQP